VFFRETATGATEPVPFCCRFETRSKFDFCTLDGRGDRVLQ
jgi:hypothetical protein